MRPSLEHKTAMAQFDNANLRNTTMKMRNLVSISLLISGLLTVISPVTADQKRTFGFFGEVNSFDRNNLTMVIDDRVFRFSDSLRVYKKKGQKGTLSEIRSGVKVGFYPGNREGRGQGNLRRLRFRIDCDRIRTRGRRTIVESARVQYDDPALVLAIRAARPSIGLRVAEDQERDSLDIQLHGETVQ